MHASHGSSQVVTGVKGLGDYGKVIRTVCIVRARPSPSTILDYHACTCSIGSNFTPSDQCLVNVVFNHARTPTRRRGS